MRSVWIAACALLAGACQPSQNNYTILGNIEDPQNEIAITIADVLNKHLPDSMHVVRGVGSLANLDSLEMGRADFGVVDNYSRFSDRVASVMPLYPQILHILYRSDKNPESIRELFRIGKVFAGIEGSGTRRFVDDLMNDLGIDSRTVAFVDVYDYFDADVIFSFTDLLTLEELRDLKEFQLFIIDDVALLWRGSLVEGICTRHPQFEPYIIARQLYGSFTPQPILTVKVDAILVCREGLDEQYVYNLMQTLQENDKELKSISPLLYHFSADFDASKLNFAVHPGARNFLNRHEPSFFERYAELMGVVVTILIALASTLYTLAQWQQQHKKNKIDGYYQKLVTLRRRIPLAQSKADLEDLKNELRAIHEETIDLVTREKLMANESFVIFLNFSRMVNDDINSKDIT